MAAPEALHRQLLPLQFTDSEIKRILNNSTRETQRIMAAMAAKGTTSAAVRSAQVALANMNVQMWNGVGDATTVGIGDAVWNATEMQALFDEDLFSAAGFQHQYWRQSMMAQAKVGVDSLISRKVNGISLSEKVYKNKAVSSGKINDLINTGLALGKSPAEIAKSVVGYVNPNTPGGASYAAMRLGRTEVVNAFHTTAVRNYQKTPWIETAIWNLSGSHKVPDACNEYAESTHTKGGEAGEFKVSDIPGKPHPNCLCYITPVMPSLEKFAKNYEAGKYDSYIDGGMGCYRVA
jgi:hypothetical protein